jgi:heme oxygenase
MNREPERPSRRTEGVSAHTGCTVVSRPVQQFSRTLIQLGLATQELQVAADAPWLELLVPTVTKRRYIEQLIKVYGFEAPLEAALRYTPGLSALVNLRPRVPAGLIAQDLMRLGLGAGRIAALGQRFVTFSSTIEALGWMYVAERATLLHGAVRRYLRSHLPDLDGATSYLAAREGIAGTRWSNLGDALEVVSDAPPAKQQLVCAAHQGFLAFCEWFEPRTARGSVGTQPCRSAARTATRGRDRTQCRTARHRYRA